MQISQTTLNIGLQLALSMVNTINSALQLRTSELSDCRKTAVRENGKAAATSIVVEPEPSVVVRPYRPIIHVGSRPNWDYRTEVQVLDYDEQVRYMESAWSLAYQRLEETREETDRSRLRMLYGEVATDVRQSIERGVRCILDRNLDQPYPGLPLRDLIELCGPYLTQDERNLLMEAVQVCNYGIHPEHLSRPYVRLKEANKAVGMLIRKVEAYTEPWNNVPTERQ
ncbi:hypothetical protein [Bifidobacterium miconisargentati]|uniref:hypothetical protein n=1 Tax=Bifidobacterium miconisargentati TaxID=2834437 RepID=UPI001BDC124E|nr:hypothetical protein [Bifidobacterium miconisargentati]MBW3090089.1 hypothetical protein [Bifidobacterium miconisargentati]